MIAKGLSLYEVCQVESMGVLSDYKIQTLPLNCERVFTYSVGYVMNLNAF